MRSTCIVLCSKVSASSSSFILFSSKFRGTSAISPSFMVGRSSSGLQNAVKVIECAYFIVLCDGKVYKKFRVLFVYEAFVVCYVLFSGAFCGCSADWSCDCERLCC